MKSNLIALKRQCSCLSIALTCLLPHASVAAADSPTDSDESALKFQGFLSVVGGEVIDGSLNGSLARPDYPCPCYIADFANAGVYKQAFSLKPESHIGAQLDYAFNPDLSATVQAISRGTVPSPDLQWAYLDYRASGSWNIHLGRQRIPLYYYSDFQDIGLSYPWISPPPEVYGWEATNYNGISARYHGTFGSVGANGSIFTGSEHVSDDQFTKLLFTDNLSVKWNSIAGANLELSKDFWTFRANYMKTNISWIDSGVDIVEQKMHAYGFALNLDFDDWFVLSEFDRQVRDNFNSGYTEISPVETIGLGYRYGAWTPFFNFARYGDHYEYAGPNIARQMVFPNEGWGVTLRYDINPTSAVKIQFDKYSDQSDGAVFSGNANVFRISYDRVF